MTIGKLLPSAGPVCAAWPPAYSTLATGPADHHHSQLHFSCLTALPHSRTIRPPNLMSWLRRLPRLRDRTTPSSEGYKLAYRLGQSLALSSVLPHLCYPSYVIEDEEHISRRRPRSNCKRGAGDAGQCMETEALHSKYKLQPSPKTL